MENILKDMLKIMQESPDEYGIGVSVTKRIKHLKQPYGGYLKRTDFDEVKLNDNKTLNEKENTHSSLVGLTVDYMSRLILGAKKSEAFKISLYGAAIIKEKDLAIELAKGIIGLDDESIVNAVRLTGFDVVYRAGPSGYVPVETISCDKETIDNIRIMIERTTSFLKEYGPITLDGFTFENAYTDIISSGDGDFLTEDTLWDLKTIKGNITKNHTLQLLVYWRMGLRSKQPEFSSIEYLGIYNPRRNIIYRLAVEDIPQDTIDTVDYIVIGYRDIFDKGK